MSMKADLTFKFLRVQIKGFSMGITEVFSRATQLFKDTLSFADGFMYMKMQLPKEIEMAIMWEEPVERPLSSE